MALAVPAAPHAATGHGHRDRAHINRVGLWLFFFSESFLFALLFASRFFLLGTEQAHVDQLLGLGITVILLLSSVTAFTAETAFETDRRRLGIWMLIATIALGLIFRRGRWLRMGDCGVLAEVR
jgi:cytochrome c oxidase subunit 3